MIGKCTFWLRGDLPSVRMADPGMDAPTVVGLSVRQHHMLMQLFEEPERLAASFEEGGRDIRVQDHSLSYIQLGWSLCFKKHCTIPTEFALWDCTLFLKMQRGMFFLGYSNKFLFPFSP